MEYNCPACNSLKHFDEVIKIEHTGETIKVVKCADCAAIVNTQIERPKGMVLKRKRGAGEIRFSENERRNFASLTLTMLKTQIKLLAAIAKAAEVDEEEIKEIIKDQMPDRDYFEYLIGEDDDSKPPDIDD